MTKREQAPVEVERKLHALSCAALSAQHSTSAKAEEAGKCRRDLEDGEVRLGVAQVAAIKAHDNAKTSKEDASKFETGYVAK